MAPKGKDVEKGESPWKDVPNWHAMTKEEVCGFLGVPSNIRETGLTSSDAAARLEKYGPNKLSEKEKVTLLQKIWKQVGNVLVGILVFVAIVSLIKGIISSGEDRVTNFIEVGLITFVITLNTCIGIYQEGSAEKAAEALKNMLSSEAILYRDGKQVKIPGIEVVPGDIVVLGTGDRVPGDIRMMEVNNFACLEAALTGESVPIEKDIDPIFVEGQDPKQTPLGDRKNMAYSGTLVAQGAAVGIVCTTGDETEIGTINSLVSQQEEKKTAVLEQIDFVSKILAGFIAVTAVVTWCVAFFKIDSKPLDALSLALVCAVAMIPEGLDAIVTMTYSWSVSNMAKNNAIIRKLPAVETLGSVTVICSDKTGTLTKNEMSLICFVTSNAHYKIDTDSKDRTANNFLRDDEYLSERSAAAKGKSAKTVIRSGPSAHQPGKQGFGFSMHGVSGHSTGSGIGDIDEPAAAEYTPIPVPRGSSPNQAFIRNTLAGGVLCSKCALGKNGGREGEIGNPTEISILRATYFAGIDIESMKKEAPIIAEVPFSSEYKFMATIHEPRAENDGSEFDGAYVAHVKGAPDRMIKLCKYQAKAGLLGEGQREPIDMAYWTEQIAILSSHGLRCLALCRGRVEKSEVSKGDQLQPGFVNERGEPWLTIMGLCAIQDPPRPECVDAIAVAHKAGVRVAMITGDHRDTALAIGDQLGLVDEKYSEAITGPELDAMNEQEMTVAVQKYNVFARASPENKIQIVKALQSQGEVCSMTGDGVNDAPALKAANMGVAMGKEGTDVAREASEMILADDNFATIVEAVKEGRVVWDNLRKVLLINTPINNAQGMSVLFGLICGLSDTPLTPIQVLYCNLICAVTLGFVAAVEPAEEGIMTKPPRRIGKRIIGRFLLLRIILATVVLVASTVGSVFWVRSEGYDLEEQRAQALNTLSFGAISVTLSARFAYNSSFHPRLLGGNVICWWSVGVMAGLQIFITYTPGLNETLFGMTGMKGKQWGIVFLFMAVTFVVMEIEKSIRRYLSSLGEDTDDAKYDPRFDQPVAQRK